MSKFSFIIPVYQCGCYLKDCVNSIRAIGLANCEILLIDDGSRDDSGQICDTLANTYCEVSCVHQENQGVSAARNHGLKLATGDYVIFLDADDSIEPDKLRELMHIVEADRSIDMAVYGLSFDYYHHGKRYRRDELSPPVTGKLESCQWMQILPQLYAANALSPIWNKVFKRSILLSHGLELSEEMFLYEDLEYSLRCMACCDAVYFSPEIVYHYRQSEDEGNAGRRLKRIEHLPALIDRIESALDFMIERKHAEKQRKKIKSILLSLYLVIAREKISVSQVKEIRNICSDFADWLRGRDLQIPERDCKFVNQMLERRVYRLIFKQAYVAMRHKLAVKVKNTKLYQKRVDI